MSETTELDKARRYLRPVARIQLPNEPDLVHLSIYQWLAKWEEWATTFALCGASAEQGALPEDTEVTCPSCLAYRPTYEAALEREVAKREPMPQTELNEQVREAVKASGLKQTWMAGRLGVSEKHLSQLLTGRMVMTVYWAQQILNLCGMELVVSVRPKPGVRR
ncbi:helix-turn-helix transcriptional regulator [Streptomyces sp. NPDC002623]